MFHELWTSTGQLDDVCVLVRQVKDLSGSLIENGCWEGYSTHRIANECYPEILVCNDTWKGNVAESIATGVKNISEILVEQRDVYGTFLQNMNTLTKGNFLPVRRDCLEWLQEYKEPIKFFYIDASHDYQSVLQTILLVKPLLVKGAMLCGDDFQNAHAGRSDLQGGVEKAVRETCPGFKTKGNLWYWINV
jgi:hypothetical protein